VVAGEKPVTCDNVFHDQQRKVRRRRTFTEWLGCVDEDEDMVVGGRELTSSQTPLIRKVGEIR
jgi:hypothetical protein